MMYRVLCVLALATAVMALNIHHLKHASKALLESENEVEADVDADVDADTDADVEADVEAEVDTQKRSCHLNHDDCSACVAAKGDHWPLLLSHACVFDKFEKQCRRAILARPFKDGWVSKDKHCAAANAITKQRNIERVKRFCKHLPGNKCRDTTNGLPDFDKALATVAELSDIVVTDVAFAGPDGPMTLHNKETPSTVDPTRSLYDVGIAYGQRPCGSGMNAAQGMNMALMKGTPNERRIDIENVADGVLATITAPACKAAVCDTLALAVLAKLKAKGATVRREWITYRYGGKSGHSVVVLNRAEGSNIDDWRTWGADAYTIDLWYKGLKSDPSLDSNGNVGSGIRWGAEQSVHAAQESRVALRGSGIGINYDSKWTSTVNDGRAHELNHVDAPAETEKFGLFSSGGPGVRKLMGDTNAHEAREFGFTKVVEGGKTFYVDEQTTPDMVD